MMGNSLPTEPLVRSFGTLDFPSAQLKSASLEPFLEVSLLKNPGKYLGSGVVMALSYLGRRDGVSSTTNQANYFVAAAAPRGGCWIFCLIKLSSKSLWSQRVARPWQPAGLCTVPRGKRQLGEPDKLFSPRLQPCQNQCSKQPLPPLSHPCRLHSIGYCPLVSSGTKENGSRIQTLTTSYRSGPHTSQKYRH